MAASLNNSDVSPSLLIRADASQAIGMGHIMRCLALAQAWRRAGGEAHFACAELPENLRRRLARHDCHVTTIEADVGSERDAEQTLKLAEQLSASTLALDGYRFAHGYASRLRRDGRRLLIIDDAATNATYDCDWLLNQNLSATAALYRGRVRGAQLLSGPRYALLDERFAQQQAATIQRETPPVARRVLITFGGTDPPNATRKVIEALARDECSGLKAEVILGGGNPRRASLARFVSNLPEGASRRIELVTDTREMSRHMADADIAVSGGGVTALELACLSVPTLLIVIADNQRAPAEAAAERGFAQLLGPIEQLDAASISRALAHLCGDAMRRNTMSRRGRETVDGRGAERVVRTLRRPAVHLRAATRDDCRLWWTWRNERETRRVSFHSKEIPLQSHIAWYHESLANPRRRMFIVGNDAQEPIGFVRLDLADDTAEISLGLAPEHRGRGYGEAVIRRAASETLAAGDADVVTAMVKEQNIASRRVFEQADFRVIERVQIAGEAALKMQFSADKAVKHEIRISKSETNSNDENQNAPNEQRHAFPF
jgi:UDP-2,4-diacetamido-2,4,6-trideoxy-beta-L-altropyranose hydrolase